LIAQSGYLKNYDYISGIHYFSHKGRTRIIRKTGNEVGAGCVLKKRVRREENGRRSCRNGREMKRRKWREWTGSSQGRLDRGGEGTANVIVGKDSFGKEEVRM